MQVNLNPSVNQVRPNFKALKSIEFVGDGLQKSKRAQKELLTIFDHPKLKSLFKKYDGKVVFKDEVVPKDRYGHGFVTDYVISCQIEIFGCAKKVFSKIKSEYLDKTKNENVSTDIIKKASNPFEEATVYLNERERVLISNFDDTVKNVSENVKKKLGEVNDEDLILEKIIEEYDWRTRHYLDNTLRNEIKRKKMIDEETTAKHDVANKLKELLGE